MSWKKVITIFLVAAVLLTALVSLTSCNNKEEIIPPIKLSDINNISQIQAEGAGDLVFEWLREFESTKPTVIIIHGETTDNSGNRFSMSLNDKEYTFKKDSPTAFTVDSTATIGWKAEGLRLDLSWYWLNVAQYNVAIFHWERFADEENPDDILAKMFSLPKMRYKTEDGYETSAVPQYSLTEVLAAVYLDEMSDKANGKEIRLVGNGVGGTLALSLTHYLATYYSNKQVEGKLVPNRLALCDPYLPTTNMNLDIKWAPIDTTKGMLSVADVMLDAIGYVGTAIEMIESLEVTDETTKYAYDFEKSEVMHAVYTSLKSKLAYFEFRQKYSVRFSNGYQKQKRVALDWYLYSIIGSDSLDIGYPTSYENYLTYSNHTWGPNATRPMVNDPHRNGKNNSYSGRNYAVSAWTPTVWIRAMKGLSYTMKKYSSTTSNNTIHGNAIYSYQLTQLEYFRSETSQISELKDYTLICGYVYKDINKNKYIDDGVTQGIANALLNVTVTTTESGTEELLSSFSVKTGSDGFYVIKFMDKTIDDEGNYSEAGFRFNTNIAVKINFVPSSNQYYNIASAVTPTAGEPYYNTVSAHNFTRYETTVSLSRYYANAITITNCLVALSK